MEITILCSNIFSSVKNEDGANSGEVEASTSTQGDTRLHSLPQTM